jgi:hypothetical protein
MSNVRRPIRLTPGSHAAVDAGGGARGNTFWPTWLYAVLGCLTCCFAMAPSSAMTVTAVPSPLPSSTVRRDFGPPSGMVVATAEEVAAFAPFATAGHVVVAAFVPAGGAATSTGHIILIKETDDRGTAPDVSAEQFSAQYQTARDEARGSDQDKDEATKRSLDGMKAICRREHMQCPHISSQSFRTSVAIDEPSRIIIRSRMEQTVEGKQPTESLLLSGNFLVHGRELQVSVIQHVTSQDDEAWFENVATPWMLSLHVRDGALVSP